MALYSEVVMDHFTHPRNVGVIENADGVGEVGNAKCGDIMKIYLKIENDIIVDVKFETFGCGSAIASSSMATEMIKGKSIQDAMQLGVLAGYPMVGVKARLTDGQYHDVDSSETAFKIAGSQVFKEGARRANPILLEPMMAVEVRTPEEYMGDVIGDLNSRRGQIQSMDDAAGVKVVKALVPLSEMFGYIGELRSRTQGRAVFTMAFDSYAEVPKAVSEEIIEKSRGE